MQTPHWPLEDAPKSYTDCVGDNRKVFCNALLYGDEMIGRIVENLRANKQYKNTAIIFLSDNGPNTNWGNKGFGQTLPLRGAKGSTFEGGIRTPAFVSGGYVEENCEMVGGAYNGMVHITDWFPIIKHIAGVRTESGDEDVDGINLFPSICGGNKPNIKRESIYHLMMSDDNDVEKGYGPSYIRSGKWKLVVNASLRTDGNSAYKYWTDYDNSFTKKPPKKTYTEMIGLDIDDKIIDVGANNVDLYQSKCFDDYVTSGRLAGGDFEYDEIMLFDISNDKVEACNVAKYYPKKVQDLMDELFSDHNIRQYKRYEKEQNTPKKQGVLAQIESFDCRTKTAYHRPWTDNEKYQGKTEKSWNDIFSYYLDIVDDCSVNHKLIGSQQMILLVSIFVIIAVILKYYMVYYKKKQLTNNKMKSDGTDITPLLSIAEHI